MSRHLRNKLIAFALLLVITAAIVVGIYHIFAARREGFFGKGTAEDPYRISTALDWDTLAYNSNNRAQVYKGSHFVLTNDINFMGGSISTVRTFSGTLDGKGYTLKNIKNAEPMRFGALNGGLFNALEGAVVKDLIVENYKYDCNTRNTSRVGVIANTTDRETLITGCHVSAEFIDDYLPISSHSSYGYYGGIVSNNLGTIEFSSVRLGRGLGIIGGIAGTNRGSILECSVEFDGTVGSGIAVASAAGYVNTIQRCVVYGRGTFLTGISNNYHQSGSTVGYDNAMVTDCLISLQYTVPNEMGYVENVEASNWYSYYWQHPDWHYLGGNAVGISEYEGDTGIVARPNYYIMREGDVLEEGVLKQGGKDMTINAQGDTAWIEFRMALNTATVVDKDVAHSQAFFAERGYDITKWHFAPNKLPRLHNTLCSGSLLRGG